MRKTLLFLLVLAGCSLFDGGPVILDKGYTDYNTYLNAELVHFPVQSARSLHFHGTQYVLSTVVSCRTLPVDTLQRLLLLRVPEKVDAEEWIRYHRADFGNEYTEIEPDQYELASGSMRLTVVHVEKEAYSNGEAEETVQRVYYTLKSEVLVFSNGVRIPPLQTEEHSCFVGDGR